MDPIWINKVKCLTDAVLKYNALEEEILYQRAKLEWIRKGDNNTAYYHATLKAKNHHKSMDMLQSEDGTVLTNQEDIKQEEVKFYSCLWVVELEVWNRLMER